MIINCPKCKQKIAKRDDLTGVFKVSYPDDRKTSDVLHQLPVNTFCKSCNMPVSITEAPEAKVSCACAKGQETYIAAPYKPERRAGKWVYVHLPAIARSVDCADVKLECPHGKCDVRMFLSEYVATGKTLATKTEENSAWSEVVDGVITVRALNNPPQEVVDATV
jgi:hypothetical protein